MEFLQKTWKFFLGIVVTVLGGMLLFRKDNTGEIIEKSTSAGDNAINEIKKSSQARDEKDAVADLAHEKEIARIDGLYRKNKDNLNLKMRAKVERSLRNGDPEAATAQLAAFLGASNLDDI